MDLIEIVKGMSHVHEPINENFKKLAIEYGEIAGSNEGESSSYYIFGSGLQIVLFKVKLANLPITTSVGGMYRSQQSTIYYRKNFKEGTKPSVAFELSGETMLSKGSSASEPGHDGFATYILRPSSITADVLVTGIAIGEAE